MGRPGFKYGLMLGHMEVLGVTVWSFLERKYIAREKERVASLRSYQLLTLCLLSSSSFSNMSLNYINFPTKVVFRSCKLIPTMLIATLINRRIFSSPEYICAICICSGLVIFAAADWNLTPSFNPIGLVLVSLSVGADSILPNLQENLFSKGSSRLEVILFTNVFTLIVMTFTTFLSGDLIGALRLAAVDHTLKLYMIIYTCVAYVAVSLHMTIVNRYGAVVGVLLGTVRKVMTLILSFLLFPKQFSWSYVIGAGLVLSGVLISSLAKHYLKPLVANKIHCSNVELNALTESEIDNTENGVSF